MIKEIGKYKFTVIMAVVMLAICIAYVFRSEPVFSVSENRYLSGRPKMTLSGLADGSFMDAFELYVKEQLPLRDALIKLKAVCSEGQFKNENNGIIRGKDGYLFEKLISTDPQLYKNEAAISNFVKETDRNINVCIIPNSFEIMTDKVPAGFPNISEEKEINAFYEKLGAFPNVKTIDMYKTLRSHKDEYIYYRTDHHWTTQGAYHGYRKLCDEMGLKGMDINDISDLKRETGDFYGTFYSKYKGTGIAPDVLTYYDIKVKGYRAGDEDHDSLYDLDKLNIYDKYAMFMYGNEGLSVVESEVTEDNKDKELIIFKDSYSNCLIPFLTYDHEKIYVVDLRFYKDPVSDLLEAHKGADVLLLYNFSHFNEDNHFYRLTSGKKDL